MEKRIFNIISRRYVPKVNKYVVELGFHREAKQTVWLTERQLEVLLYCFEQTKKGYFDKNKSVIGVWNEKGYFAYAKVIEHIQPKQFKEPRQHDLSDLQEVD